MYWLAIYLLMYMHLMVCDMLPFLSSRKIALQEAGGFHQCWQLWPETLSFPQLISLILHSLLGLSFFSSIFYFFSLLCFFLSFLFLSFTFFLFISFFPSSFSILGFLLSFLFPSFHLSLPPFPSSFFFFLLTHSFTPQQMSTNLAPRDPNCMGGIIWETRLWYYWYHK